MSSDLGPSRKRARVELEADPDGEERVVWVDQQVWFCDGNVVVVAADKVAFRIHKGTLSLRSEVFRDLFSLADTDAASSTWDGCPVVHLTDSPEDIRHVFLVLCSTTTAATRPSPPRSPSSPRSSARPTSTPSKTSSTTPSPASKNTTPTISPSGKIPTPARGTSPPPHRTPRRPSTSPGSPTPRPCSRPPSSCATTHELAETWDTAPDGAPVSRMAALSVPDQTRVIWRSGSWCTRAFHLLAAVPSAHCATREACGAAREAPLAGLAGSSCLFESMADRHALTPMADIFWARLDHWTEFCESCKEALVGEDERMIRLLWNLLPHMFALRIGVESWPSRPAATTVHERSMTM